MEKLELLHIANGTQYSSANLEDNLALPKNGMY